MPIIERIHHASLLIEDLDTALAFYRDLLGLEPDPARPDLGYPGAWLNIGSQQVHLMQLPNPDPKQGRPAHGGRDRHLAFQINDIKRLQTVLDEAGVPYTLSKSGRSALFCRDPDGNALEFVETAT